MIIYIFVLPSVSLWNWAKTWCPLICTQILFHFVVVPDVLLLRQMWARFEEDSSQRSPFLSPRLCCIVSNHSVMSPSKLDSTVRPEFLLIFLLFCVFFHFCLNFFWWSLVTWGTNFVILIDKGNHQICKLIGGIDLYIKLI